MAGNSTDSECNPSCLLLTYKDSVFSSFFNSPTICVFISWPKISWDRNYRVTSLGLLSHEFNKVWQELRYEKFFSLNRVIFPKSPAVIHLIECFVMFQIFSENFKDTESNLSFMYYLYSIVYCYSQGKLATVLKWNLFLLYHWKNP